MAPVTSDLIQISRKSITTEPQNVQQHPTHQQISSNPIGNFKVSKQKEIKSISPATIKLPEKIEQAPVSTSSPHQPKSNKIPLKLVNAHITCSICEGYLIDATTLVECLHSFCHSCIMKHLRIQDYCPKCEVLVNKAKLNIKPDTTLQAIIYKLVPELYEKELLRRRAFYKMCPKEAALAAPDQRGEDTENLIFSPREALSLSLEFADMEKLPKKSELKKPIYLQCPAIFQVSHLKKFILSKFGIDGNLLSVELMYKVKTIVLSDHYTLMDIAYIYTWKRDAPMRFFFRVIKNLHPVITSKPNEETMVESLSSKAITVCQKYNNNDQTRIEDKTENENTKCETNNNSVSSVISNSENVNNNNRKHESIKLKIEISKQGNMVSILKSGSQPDNSDKIVKITNEDRDKTLSKSCETMKQNQPLPKLLLLKSKPLKNANKSSKDTIAKIKLKETVKKLMKGQHLNNNNNKKNQEVVSEKLVKTSSELSKKSQTKFNPITSVPDIDPKKSEFLNAFQLAPRKIVPSSPSSTSPQKPLRPIAPKAAIPSLKPLSAYLSAMPKRKNKELSKSGVNNNNTTSNKKSKTNDLKQVLEKIIREKSNQNAANDKKETISFNLAPFPIGSSRIENTPTSSSVFPSTQPSTSTTTKASQSPIVDSQASVSAVTLTNAASTATKGILPVSNSNSNNAQKQQQAVSNNNKNIYKNSNNASPKQIVPKRSASPNTGKTSLEPVFKKPMTIAKKSATTPEKPKPSDTQIHTIKNGNSGKKVFGPPSLPPIAPRNVPFTPPHKPNNYLNFALMNSSKNPEQMRMSRAPIYSPFSPVYAPNSPQYTPNFNIQSRPTFKYTNPQAYANLMDNLYKTNDLFPGHLNNIPSNPTKSLSPKNSNAETSTNKTSTSIEPRTSPKLPTKSVTPPMSNISPTMKHQEKPNANSLLNKLNFPSSLSVTLTDTDDSRTNSPNNKNHSSVNNYIEIVKLPESPTNHNNTNNVHSNGVQSSTSSNKTPPGCISPPKTIIKIDDVKNMGENVHKDIINKVNEMCSTDRTGQSKSPKSGDVDNILNKEKGSGSSVAPVVKSNTNGKETFQTKFLESILPKLNEKVSKEESEKSKTTSVTKTYSKANPVVSQGGPAVPAYSKAVQNKLDELRKISPKPPQNKSKPNNLPSKTSPTIGPASLDQRSVPQHPNSPTLTNNYPTYDPAKLANLFNDFAQASQNPMQSMFPAMAANPMTAFNTVPMVNLMQQAYLMEQWQNLQKLQKFQKTAEQTYLENCLQNLKQNNNQASSNRLE